MIMNRLFKWNQFFNYSQDRFQLSDVQDQVQVKLVGNAEPKSVVVTAGVMKFLKMIKIKSSSFDSLK